MRSAGGLFLRLRSLMFMGDRGAFQRLRKIFALGKVTAPDAAKPQVQTRRGVILKKAVLWPYGFSSFPEEGTVVVLFQGGDQGAGEIIGISDQKDAPSLGSGDAALWSKGGAQVITKNSGKVDIHSKTKNLKTILDTLIDICQSINTVGGPAAQNLNPALVTQLTVLKTDVAALLDEGSGV